jgi:LacI family transcriptional regulator
MPDRPPSLRQVAAAAGVSPATASMALRHLARVPEPTRRKVEKAAARLGYVRDPEIGNILARSRRKTREARETIAFLAEIPIGAKPDPRAPWIHQLHEAAAAAAHLEGCELESFVISHDPGRTRELGHSLWLRGIRGLLVAPMTLSEPARIELDWSKFAAVEIGSTLDFPKLHRVERQFFEDCRHLYAHLHQRRRRRIGLALSPQRRRFLRDIPEAALLLHTEQTPGAERVLPLPPGDWTSPGFRAWLEREKPDCLVVYENEPVSWLQAVPRRKAGRLGIAHLSVARRHETGLVPDIAAMVKDAVQLLHQMIASGERGQPRRRRSHGFRNLLQAGRTA